MKIQINQQEIEQAIKYYIANTYGINISKADINLTATRGADGVIADIEINGLCGNGKSDSRNNESTTKVQKEEEKEAKQETVSDADTRDEYSGDDSDNEGEDNGEDVSDAETPSNGVNRTASLFGNLKN